MSEHEELKQSTLDVLRQVAGLAERSGATSLAAQLRGDRIPRLSAERFHLVVLGEFNHGKTTFVNALVGEPLLPAGVTPTTALIHTLEYGEEPSARACKEESAEEVVPIEGLGEYEVGGKGLRDSIDRLAIRHPAALLEEGVVLVDTPGVNDINEARAEITYGYIPRADAVLFLLDAGQILKESERTFVASKLLSASRDKVIFIVNKMDLLSESEREEALTYARSHLEKLVDDPKVFGISAQLHLEGKEEESGVPELLSELRRFLREERGRVLLGNAIDAGIRTIATLRSGIEIQRQALEMESEERERRLRALEADLVASDARLEEREQKIHRDIAAIEAVVRSDVIRFGRRFAQALPAEIEASEAKDLQSYLGGFIESRFREMAEEQAEKIELELERVAEEAIAFVADEARARASSLEATLGEGSVEIDLAIDTRPYDVGVFAVGAFGVTLMMFSNVLVGGAMALAAPLLAYIVKGRVEQKVKERAREDAPRVVMEAAQRMADGLEARIDEFAEKLIIFVRQANREMTRSVAELVRRAEEAAQESEEEKEALASTAGMHLAQLSELRDRLEAMHRALWFHGTRGTA